MVVFNFARDAGVELMGIKSGDLLYAATAFDERIPKIVLVVTDWRNHSHTGNHHAWVRHDGLFCALAGLFLDIFHCFTDRGHLFSVFVRNLDPKLLF